jgi:O-antigen/teichoic acid export membrane protein
VKDLAKNGIRLRYSGFVMFIAKMLSVVTGLAFTLMITRTTTPEQYGILSNINDLLGYFALPAIIFPFWTLRFVARNKEGAIKTGILANLIISIIATTIYLLLIPTIILMLGVNGIYVILYLVAAMQLMEAYFIYMLEACLRPKMPQTIGYGIIVEESCKVLLGYILIVRLQQALMGILLSMIIGVAVHIAYYLKLLLPELKQSIKWSYVKEWLKGSALNVYSYIGGNIAAFTSILLIIYGGQAARGQYQAAITIASIIMYSSFLSFPLYPILLGENSAKDTRHALITSLKTVLMFAIPMTTGAIVLSNSYLITLNEIYAEATPVLIVLAINAFVQIISQFFSSVLFGLEKADEKAKIPLRKLVKSPLFKAFTLSYVQASITLPITFYALVMFAQNQPITAAIYVGIIDTIARLVVFLILYAIVRKMVKSIIPWKNISKYVFASAIMAFALFLLPHPTRLSSTLGVTAVGAILYFTLLMAIDKETRALFNSILQEIKFKVK